MTLDTGNVEVLEELFELYDDLDIVALAKMYLRQAKGLTTEKIEDLNLELNSIDDEMGYIVMMQGENDDEFIGFSDAFVTTFNKSSHGANADLDTIWINIIARRLEKISGFRANQYMVSIYDIVDSLENGVDGAKITEAQAKDMKERLFAIETGYFTPTKQKMTEAEKIAFMTENVD